MIRQRGAIVMLIATATVISLLLMLAPPAVMGRQVGVKAPPAPTPKNNPPPKKNAPPSKPTKKPPETRPAPKTSKPTIDATYPVLSRIETYKAPPDRIPHLETYGGPATSSDVLVADIWQRVRIDLKLNLSPKEASVETINRAINIYLTRDWRHVSGYRPWTHWNFIRQLKAAEREALAKEITGYVAKNGVKDVQ